MSSSPVVERRATRGQLFIVSAPSGTGKTTLVERLVQCVPGLRMSRSYTSRPARVGEQDGVDYNFITRERFETMVREGQFLEWADVFGNYYGTSAADTEVTLARGEDVERWTDFWIELLHQYEAECDMEAVLTSGATP